MITMVRVSRGARKILCRHGIVLVTEVNGCEQVEATSEEMAAALERVHGFARSPSLLGTAASSLIVCDDAEISALVEGPVEQVITRINEWAAAASTATETDLPGWGALLTRLRDAEVNRRMAPRKSVMLRFTQLGI